MKIIKSDAISHETLLDAVAATYASLVAYRGVYDHDRGQKIHFDRYAQPDPPASSDLDVLREEAVADLYMTLHGTDYRDQDEEDDHMIEDELWSRYWTVLGGLCRDYTHEKQTRYGNALSWAQALFPAPQI